MSRLIRAVIDTQALRHNLNVIRARAGRAKVIAVVKANAYGHGLVSAALAIQDAGAYRRGAPRGGHVAARGGHHLAHRAAGGRGSAARSSRTPRTTILISWCMTPRQIELLEQTGGAGRFAVWIKIDTGMNRLGFAPRDFAAALERIRGLASRAARAAPHDAPGVRRRARRRATRAQLVRFREATQGLSYETSIVNSAGLLAEVAAGSHWVRPGLALYGASPFEDTTAAEFGLRPVMTLTSTVLTVREVRRGEAVGYGGRLDGAARLAGSRSSRPATGMAYTAASPRARRC